MDKTLHLTLGHAHRRLHMTPCNRSHGPTKGALRYPLISQTDNVAMKKCQASCQMQTPV